MGSKLDIHSSKNKNAADDHIVGKVSKRFYDDGYDEGDWGRADTKYAPGATYDSELNMNTPLGETEMPKGIKLKSAEPNSWAIDSTDKKNKPERYEVHHNNEHIGHIEKYTSPVYKKIGRLADSTGKHSVGWAAHDLKNKEHTPDYHRPKSKVGAVDELIRGIGRQVQKSTVQEIKNPDHFKIKDILKEYGFVRTKGGLYLNSIGFQVKYQLPDGSFWIEGKRGMQAAQLREHLEQERMMKTKKEQIQEAPILNTRLLMSVLTEAAAFEKLKTTTCDICGGNHPESKHVKAPGAFAAEGEAEEFQGANDQLVGVSERHHDPINQKGSLWKRLKKKLQLEDEGEEDPSPDELMKASFGKTTDGKDVLDELGENYHIAKQVRDSLEAAHKKHSDALNAFPKGHFNLTPDHVKATPEWKAAKLSANASQRRLQDFNSEFVRKYKKDIADDRRRKLGEAEEKKPWRVIDMTTNRHVDTVHAHTEKGAKQQMSKKGHDSRFHTVRLQEAKKKFPKFDQGKEVRAIARERVGQPKSKQVIVSKKDKPAKYKPNFED